MIVFAHPELLYLLILIPLLALLKGRKGLAGAVRFSTTVTAKKVASSKKVRPGRILSSLRILALTILIVTLARPQFGESTTEVEASGIDILLAVDSSTSMDALDFKIKGKNVDRLSVVKKVVADFIKKRPNDRIGLVAFAGTAYSMCPLSLDHNWLQKRLDQVVSGVIEDGTAIGSAIAAATNRLREQKSKSRIMILLTDGMNNRGKVSPETAADAAKALGIKIYTIGAGSKGKAPYKVKDAFGRDRIITIDVDIDEDTLKKVARATDGKYFRATDTNSLEDIYDDINNLEVTTRKIRKFENYEELFFWGIAAAFAVLGLELLLAQTKFLRLP